MRQRLVTPTRFGKAGGVSHQAIAKSKTLAPARTKEGRVNVAHPVARAWLAERNAKPSDIDPTLADLDKTPIDAAQDRGGEEAETPLDPNMTLAEITDRWGTCAEFSDWLKARKLLAEALRIETLLAEDRGRLVERELVKTHVLAYLDTLNTRLLSDIPRTVARQVSAQARAGEPLEAMQKTIREIMSITVKGTRDQITKNLRAITKKKEAS